MIAQRNPILILDDDPELLRLVRKTLERDDWTVETAVNGREALERCEQQRPGLIFVDLMLPYMDGEEFVGRLRERYGDDVPPIVVISASTVRTEVAARIGAQASLPKPFHLEDLSALARKYAGSE